jgi:hypothetical protein
MCQSSQYASELMAISEGPSWAVQTPDTYYSGKSRLIHSLSDCGRGVGVCSRSLPDPAPPPNVRTESEDPRRVEPDRPPVPQLGGADQSPASARSAKTCLAASLSTLPIAERGTSETTTNRLGTLSTAMAFRQKSMRLSAVTPGSARRHQTYQPLTHLVVRLAEERDVLHAGVGWRSGQLQWRRVQRPPRIVL